MKVKVCGMKYNTQEVAALQPDYLGFIFYGKSPRDFEGLEIPVLSAGIKKVGVFVDAEYAFAKACIEKYHLDVIQLHGSESPDYIAALRLRSGLSMSKPNPKNLAPRTGSVHKRVINNSNPERSRRVHLEVKVPVPSGVKVPAPSGVEVWKVFGIKDSFDFNQLKPYEGLVDAFLFDTKGAAKGGNGYTFDWSVLKDYPSQTPFVLSGGIGLDEVEKVKEILATDLPIIALDVNSKFEVKPGLKNIEGLEKFKEQLDISPNPSSKRGTNNSLL